MKTVYMQILGVDEAGRGCVIGPLVIAGVLIDERSEPKLFELGVKDSKLLSRHRREQLAKEIEQVAIDTYVIKLSPSEIDRAVNSRRKLHKLNRLEAKTMAKVIEALRPDIAIVDASDVLPDRYKQHITECLSFQVQVVSEHKADKNYPVVSAASIIAKVERDRSIDELKAQHGDFGSGYMANPKTMAFLETLVKKYGAYPDFVRRSWKPAKTAKTDAKMKQTQLHKT
ncbi:MAG: ribonuclease HII [Candidatus Bathyarchaeota archaeon]|nr:ribonuclease HII [Candidatus Bathyarchaeota archaeon]MDH5494145.1 ribonuclease HII [Candidatus Bathyarchaeota archaeon]